MSFCINDVQSHFLTLTVVEKHITVVALAKTNNSILQVSFKIEFCNHQFES